MILQPRGLPCFIQQPLRCRCQVPGTLFNQSLFIWFITFKRCPPTQLLPAVCQDLEKTFVANDLAKKWLTLLYLATFKMLMTGSCMSSPSVPHVGPGQGLQSPDIGRLLSSVGYFIHTKYCKDIFASTLCGKNGCPFQDFLHFCVENNTVKAPIPWNSFSQIYS